MCPAQQNTIRTKKHKTAERSPLRLLNAPLRSWCGAFDCCSDPWAYEYESLECKHSSRHDFILSHNLFLKHCLSHFILSHIFVTHFLIPPRPTAWHLLRSARDRRATFPCVTQAPSCSSSHLATSRRAASLAKALAPASASACVALKGPSRPPSSAHTT